MRCVYVVLLAMVSMSVHAGMAPGSGKPTERKNFVFFLVDDLGWADLGYSGSTFHETPHIDALAASGMRFTQGYAACPVCSPTRASIMTGFPKFVYQTSAAARPDLADPVLTRPPVSSQRTYLSTA